MGAVVRSVKTFLWQPQQMKEVSNLDFFFFFGKDLQFSMSLTRFLSRGTTTPATFSTGYKQLTVFVSLRDFVFKQQVITSLSC